MATTNHRIRQEAPPLERNVSNQLPRPSSSTRSKAIKRLRITDTARCAPLERNGSLLATRLQFQQRKRMERRARLRRKNEN
ncbi:hypothetical protein PRIPAC_90785 [Pristionchus pacificus]|uniref:Uncharacterized protein n=1 Tax=Pristionchus pacificus TaxID=54126 RepID=A0A2A6B898_PRIPA|nr:hypothetical protein PRIPAC_90785 [Pristionchus pacificus]|eukprot:PDM62087.1 hypothetical protein PRIPAC_51529 [Pristionchus pacificus]